MKSIIYFKSLIFCLIFTLLTVVIGHAQAAKSLQPRQEVLLNGLKLHIWYDSAAKNETIKVRIHSGSAFDPKDKMGVMALLSDILFPTEQSKAYFLEDLEGSLDVTSNPDFIQITATGKSDELVAMMETLSVAVINPPITQENFMTVRNHKAQKIAELEKNPVFMADRAAAKRLLGDFPYGRSSEGTSASLAKIDRFDLVFARERFLTADNATVAMIGNVKPDYAYRVARRLFGAWGKADKKTPPTFRQPDPPDTKLMVIDSPGAQTMEIRRTWRGLARNDKDYAAAQILTRIWQDRLGTSAIIENKTHVLPGYFMLRVSGPAMETPASGDTIPLPVKASDFMKMPPTTAEFEKVQNDLASALPQINSSFEALSNLWLDVDTFHLQSADVELQAIRSASLADVQRLAERFGKETEVSVVVTGKPATNQ